MALPTFKAAGTFTAGTGNITPPYPASPNAPVANDIAILVVESENEGIAFVDLEDRGFVELGSQANKAAGTSGVNPASRLAVFWKRCVGGDVAPTILDPGNHATGRIYLFSGVITTGNPWDVYAEGNDGGANDTTGVIPGATTTVAECLIFLICTSSYNGNSTAQFASWTNAALANILERGDNTNTAGLGGGHGSATGEKATAGAYGDTTVTLAQTSYKGTMSIALKPPPAATPITDSQPAYTGGHTAITDAQPSYARGHATSTDSQPAYAGGHVALTDSQPSYTAGYGSLADSQPAYTAGTPFNITDSQPAYAGGYGSATDSQPSYARGHSALTDGQASYARGHVALTDTQVAFAWGYIAVTDSQPSYIAGHYSVTDSQPAYTRGLATITAGQAAYIEGTSSIATCWSEEEGG